MLFHQARIAPSVEPPVNTEPTFDDWGGASAIFFQKISDCWELLVSFDGKISVQKDVLMVHDTDLMTEQLLQKAALGDGSAVDRLFQQHRPRIRQMIQMRLDPRITSRVDPSDVVQETLAEAHQRLNDYLRDRPLPFYLWLRKLAWDRLCDAHRRHIRAQKRSVLREDRRDVGLSDESAGRLASRLLGKSPTASQAAIREELRLQVRQALDQLSAVEREILLMRHVEQMSLEEIAAANDIPVGTAKSRIFRALEKLHRLLEK